MTTTAETPQHDAGCGKFGSGPRAAGQALQARIAIQHPDLETGERLVAEALGAVDRDALHGIFKQLVKASVIRQKPDEDNLAFMISMMKSIAPQESLEAMLAAQMVSIHVATMRFACRLAFADDIPQQEEPHARTDPAGAHLRSPDGGPQPPPQQRRACDHGAEFVGAGWRQGHRGQCHATRSMIVTSRTLRQCRTIPP